MTAYAMMFLHALTGLHPGSGTALGVVDLPVRRERHTGFPTIPGSSIKGVMRAAALDRRGREDPDLVAVFGPDTANAADHAGALAFTDARLLAFPVRSLRGAFAWVTCPSVLDRLARDAALAGERAPAPSLPQEREAVIPTGSPLEIKDGNRRGLVLEEFDCAVTPGADGLADWIAKQGVADDATAERIRRHTAIIDDNVFTHFVQYATEVTARIALDCETKTVAKSALSYEEFLPSETLFYSVLIADDSRRAGHKVKAEGILSWLRGLDLRTLQIGGGETIGKGLCTVRITNDGAAA